MACVNHTTPNIYDLKLCFLTLLLQNDIDKCIFLFKMIFNSNRRFKIASVQRLQIPPNYVFVSARCLGDACQREFPERFFLVCNVLMSHLYFHKRVLHHYIPIKQPLSASRRSLFFFDKYLKKYIKCIIFMFSKFSAVESRIKSLFKLILIPISAEFNKIFNKINFLGELLGKILCCFIHQLITQYALH